MRASMESERQRAIAETIRQCELEKQRAVEETKKKQWCTNCGKEALFYCCWNTSYCDYPCQVMWDSVCQCYCTSEMQWSKVKNKYLVQCSTYFADTCAVICVAHPPWCLLQIWNCCYKINIVWQMSRCAGSDNFSFCLM